MANFNRNDPFYRAIAATAAVRKGDAALRRGWTLVHEAGEAPGIFAFSRIIDGEPGETLATMNTATTAATVDVLVDPSSRQRRALSGSCAATATAPGSYRGRLALLAWGVCTTRPAESRP